MSSHKISYIPGVAVSLAQISPSKISSELTKQILANNVLEVSTWLRITDTIELIPWQKVIKRFRTKWLVVKAVCAPSSAFPLSATYFQRSVYHSLLSAPAIWLPLPAARSAPCSVPPRNNVRCKKRENTREREKFAQLREGSTGKQRKRAQQLSRDTASGIYCSGCGLMKLT